MTVLARRWTFEDLARQNRDVLESLLLGGAPPATRQLVGFEYRGWNVNPATVLIGTRKFRKGFYRDDAHGPTWGYNVRVRQGRIDEPWIALPSEDHPDHIYFFGVSDPAQGNRYPNAVVIDYRSWPGTCRLHPIRSVVDYLVFPDPANVDLLLGKSYADLPFLSVFLGFFILERWTPQIRGGVREGRP